MKQRFNLAAWSLEHKPLIYFFMGLLMLAGCLSYWKLGRMEDPDYTIRQMVVTTSWPGATAEQVEDQVTEKLEKSLQDLEGLDNLQSYSSPGQSVITVELKDTINKKDIQSRWTDARNLVTAAAADLPAGVEKPAIDDHFDAVYGMVYALTAEQGYNFQEMKAQAEKIRQRILTLPQTKKVELLGTQTECIYLDADSSKMLRLGLGAADIEQRLQEENSVVSSGVAAMSGNQLPVHLKDNFANPSEIEKLTFLKNGRSLHFADFATVQRSYQEPGEPKFFYQGQPAIGIAVSMNAGENIMEYGTALEKLVAATAKELPAGMELHQTVNQAQTVHDAIFDFVRSLAEALIIIFAVSLFSLGRREGLVVAICIPFVLAVVFSVMYLLHIDLQRVSLGALIIGLGLLVDDAMIVVEMIIVKLDEGWEKSVAVVHAFEVTAIPMLTGTLITCAGFIPVAFATGSSSEFCSSLFSVISIALLASWVTAGAVTPLLGHYFIERKTMTKSVGCMADWMKRFYAWYEQILLAAIFHRKKVLLGVIVIFLLSCFALTQVRQESFPASTRPELIVRMEFPETSSLAYAEKSGAQLAKEIAADVDVESFTYTTGMGEPRFVLSFDPAPTKPNLVEFLVVAKDLAARKRLEKKLQDQLSEEFPEAQLHLKVLVTGSSSEYPVMLCVKGPELSKVREIASKVEAVMRAHPAVRNTTQTSGKQLQGIHLELDEERARQLGVTPRSLGQDVCQSIEGKRISTYQEGDESLPVILRYRNGGDDLLSSLGQTPVQLENGRKVSLDQVARVSLQSEPASIFRKNRQPAIQVCADVQGQTGEDVTQEVYDQLAEMRAALPAGYSIELDGALKDSNSNNASFLAPMPIMVLIILVLLMLQLQNLVKTGLTLLTAPLGIIGVALGLVLTGKPFGFVVLMGILALFGIIIRNSVILIDQIEKHRAEGEAVLNALVHASKSRLRPIMLTAMAAVLAMVPLAFNVFWGPMAVAMGAGLLVATVLTLLVLPVMYAGCYLSHS